MVTNVTIRGLLAVALVAGLISYFLIYQSAPVDLVVLTSTALGYFFGHNGAESAGISQRQNGTAVIPDVLSTGKQQPPAAH